MKQTVNFTRTFNDGPLVGLSIPQSVTYHGGLPSVVAKRVVSGLPRTFKAIGGSMVTDSGFAVTA